MRESTCDFRRFGGPECRLFCKDLALLFGNYPDKALPELFYDLFLARTESRREGGGGWDGSRTRPETADLFWKKNMKYVLLYSKSMTDCVLEK